MHRKIEGLAGTAEMASAFASGLRPDPIETIDAWADRERYLSPEASAEHGLYRTDRTPYLRAIMEDLSPNSPIERVVFMKSAQVGASETGNNFLAYIIAKGLGPTLVVQSTLDIALDYSKQRLDPMVRDSPCLRALLGDRRQSKGGNNTLGFKSFPGGVIILRGAESAKGLRSMPIKNLFLDEVDAYPRDVEGEGDPVDLATKRTETFTRRKIFVVSTPTIEGDSRISDSYELTDQRHFLVPCPSCGEFQRLVWARIKFDRHKDGTLKPESVRYACCGCGDLLKDDQKMGMLRKGHWEPTAKSSSPVVRGYHISALYSPWASWVQIAENFLAAKSNPRKLQTFVNTYLGETYANQGEAPDWGKLWRRREKYDSDLIPQGVVILTAGVDVQPDRFEMEIVGWGPRLESWSIQYEVIHGDTATDPPYQELEKFLKQTWRHESGGRIGLSRMMIDAGDGAGGVMNIYRWARPHVPRVMPIRGRADASQIVYRQREATLRKGKSRRAALGMFWPVGVSLVKSELYSFLRLEEPETGEPLPPGWCHFPESYDDEFFKQLTAERRKLRPNSQGIPKASWKVIEGRRNEALDCRVYARAAAFVEGIDSWSPARWEEERQDLLPPEEQQEKPKLKKASKPQNTNFIRKPRGGKRWLDGHRSS